MQEKMDTPVLVQVTNTMKEALRATAQHYGMTVSDVVRSLIIRGAPDMYPEFDNFYKRYTEYRDSDDLTKLFADDEKRSE